MEMKVSPDKSGRVRRVGDTSRWTDAPHQGNFGGRSWCIRESGTAPNGDRLGGSRSRSRGEETKIHKMFEEGGAEETIHKVNNNDGY